MGTKLGITVATIWSSIAFPAQEGGRPLQLSRPGHARNFSDTALILAVQQNRAHYAQAVIPVQPSIQRSADVEQTPLIVTVPRPQQHCCCDNVLMPYLVWGYDVACFQVNTSERRRRNGRWGCCVAGCTCALLGVLGYFSYIFFYTPPITCCDNITMAGIFGIPPAIPCWCSALSSKPPWQYTKDDVYACMNQSD